MRAKVSIVLVLIVAMSGCLGRGDAEEGNWVVEAVQVENTTGVPVHDVTRAELAQNDDVLKVIEEAFETGEGQRFMTDREAEAAIRFVERNETVDPGDRHGARPKGVYFRYRNETIVVEDAIHDVTQG